MLAKLYSGAIIGLEGVLIEVEVDLVKRGFPNFTIVGLADKAIQEAKERIRSALINSGLEFPNYRVTVNLAPAEIQKEGTGFDLPIALGILIASGQINDPTLEKALTWGELSLEGTLRSTPSVLPLTMLAKEQGLNTVFVPKVNAKEAGLVSDMAVMPVASLKELAEHFTGLRPIEKIASFNLSTFDNPQVQEGEGVDFADIIGQEQAKRALEIAAAGGHNLFLKGPPGSGKTLLSRAFASILPRMTPGEILAVTRIYSIAGLLNPEKPMITTRPFRSPHHTTSRIGLIGGGSKISPGEISLAHRGVLFLDEFPELPRSVLESLRQPLEDGFVQISRAAGSLKFPAQFILIAAVNPCPCGWYQSKIKKCICTSHQIYTYSKRISGPILDRIDLYVEVPEVEQEKLIGQTVAESSKTIQERVQMARERQLERFKDLKIVSNSELTSKGIKEYCVLNEESRLLLKQAINTLNLTARSFHKIIKVARTIADLEGAQEIKTNHLAESLQYRSRN